MEQVLLTTLITSLLCTVTRSNPIGQECNQYFEGWTKVHHQCIYTEGIDNCQQPVPEVFPSLEDCQRSLSKTRDHCSRGICNRGFCANTRLWSGRSSYKCYCDGTGFYGQNCEIRCPRIFPVPRHFPVACILI